MKLQMTEVQKAYLLGRNETFDGKTGTHMYLEMSYKGSIKQFELAFNYLIEKQPMLRAKVESFGYFEILPEYSYEIEVTECSTDNIEEVKSQKRQNLSQKLYRRDDFPFYTIEALSINESEYENIILFSIDLLIADGMSLFYLFDCLNKLLNNELDNGFYLEDRTVELMEINEAYLKEKVSNRYLKDKEYWQNKILDLPASPSLLLHEENAINSKFSRKEFNFSEKELLKLQKIAQERDISLSTLLLTLYGITLRRWSELDEFTINMTTFKRPRKNKKYLEVIGDFTSTTLVDLNINLNQSVIENTRSAHHKVFQAMKHSKFEGVEVLRELGKSNKSNLMPFVFTSMLFEFDDFNSLGAIEYWISETPQVFLDCQIKIINGELNISWDFLEDIFDSIQIKEMFDFYLKQIKLFLTNPETCMEESNLYINQNILENFKDYNKRESIILSPTISVLEKFNEIALSLPKSVSFSDGENELTFEELRQSSSDLHQRIVKIKKDNSYKKIRIGIKGNKTIESVIEMMAVIMLGDSFCFIPNDISPNRMDKLLKNNSITLLIQDNQIIDTNQIPLEKVPKDELYSIFTSGTTGEPKGISISEAAVLNTIDDIIERTSLSREDTIFNVSNLTFDLSIFDLLAPLVIGCSTYLSSDIDLKKHREQIIQSSFWNSTPGLVQLLLNEIDIENSKLRNILMSGDFISSQLVQDIEKKFINKDINIFSLGGATEASIWSIYFPLNNFDGHKIPYGYPLSNQAFYVVDFEDNLVNMNTLGELVISGKGVANGYINNKDSTSVFYKHPKLGYIYKTGDKGYLASDGKLYITGRMKSEMKLNGYRIDLVEIQNSLLLDDCIDKAKVVIEKNSNGKDYLIAYCVSSEPEISGSEIRNRMKDHLPSYMIPTSFVFIESFPLTNNGKIDMRQLKNLYLNYHKEQELNDKEKELLSVWKEVLDIDSNDVSRMSTFFELGGDSIKLPELLYLINQKYGVSLSIEELLNKFTLHEQAQYIEELVNLINKSTIRLNKNIVQLKKGTSNKNVILIHAGSGEIGIYNNLSKNIDDTYNVYAIKFDKDTNVLHPRTLELDELAKLYNSYLEVFENIEILGGWCIGGTIGYEICKFNKKVKNLLLINSLPPVDKKEHVFDFTLFSERNLIYQSFGYKDTKANNLLELWEDVVSTIEGNSRLLESLISIVPRELSRLIPFFGENNPNPKELIYYINLFRSFELARKIYQSDFIINQNIYYLGASKEQVENYQKWKTLSKGEWNEGLVSGDHTTIFDKDNVAMMAEYINEVK